jgi:hypothetical protein
LRQRPKIAATFRPSAVVPILPTPDREFPRPVNGKPHLVPLAARQRQRRNPQDRQAPVDVDYPRLHAAPLSIVIFRRSKPKPANL